MARDVGAIRAGCKAAWSREDSPEDCALIRVPWREDVCDDKRCL